MQSLSDAEHVWAGSRTPLDPKIHSKCILYVFTWRKNVYVKIDMCKMEPGMFPSGLRSAFSSRISYLSVWHNLTSYPSHHQHLSVSTSPWPMLSFLITWVIAKGCWVVSLLPLMYTRTLNPSPRWTNMILRNAVFRALFLCLNSLMTSHRAEIPSKSL